LKRFAHEFTSVGRLLILNSGAPLSAIVTLEVVHVCGDEPAHENCTLLGVTVSLCNAGAASVTLNCCVADVESVKVMVHVPVSAPCP
jgi:hypothetical protein